MSEPHIRFAPATHAATGRPRARGLGLKLPGTPGPLNAITDVAGVAVGTTTLTVPQDGILTGVTAVLPRPPDALLEPIWAGAFSMNGNGEMTGVHWIHEAGWFTGPITLTNTLSLGIAHHATARWMCRQFGPVIGEDLWVLPVVAETYDGYLNDISGFHITEEHVRAAIDGARGGAVAEGSVGGGAGMICYEYKGGTGTASRIAHTPTGAFTVGALVQANHGIRPWLTVCGRRLGDALTDNLLWTRERGSIIVILATDAPLLPTQMQRLAKRAAIGIGRGGTPSGNNSGDIFLAFTTANSPGPLPEPPRLKLEALSSDDLDPIFLAAVESVEEAVLNAMLAADPVTGKRGRHVAALDGARLAELVG
ncbi:MAG: aminopeptidase [Rhizobiales bacterium 24-66-13]|jgi:L-aminopeptidase/D-esterase-like protein|nr:MAG: aminopeptidase [Rhizobiales bacterium 24-66-13]HQS09035.1 P1 family peptidase [Xanthobacteraceae bacterium]